MTDRIHPEELQMLLDEAAAMPKPVDFRYQIDITSRDGCLILTIGGTVLQPIPTEFSDRLEILLERGAGRRVAIDLAGCNYLSSSVIGTLVSFFGASAKSGGQVVLIRPPPRVEAVLRAVGLDQFFLLVDSLDVAMEFFRAQESGTRQLAVKPKDSPPA